MATIRERSLEIGREITLRYFLAIDQLVEQGKINSRNTICKEMGVSESNYHILRIQENRTILLYMLTYAVSRYRVDGTWLLTGKGDIFREDEEVKDIPTEELKSNRPVTDRFFQGIELLIDLRKIPDPYDIFPQMGFAKTVYPTLKANRTKNVTLAMCHQFVIRYGINGTWLLSDIGEKIR